MWLSPNHQDRIYGSIWLSHKEQRRLHSQAPPISLVGLWLSWRWMLLRGRVLKNGLRVGYLVGKQRQDLKNECNWHEVPGFSVSPCRRENEAIDARSWGGLAFARLEYISYPLAWSKVTSVRWIGELFGTGKLRWNGVKCLAGSGLVTTWFSILGRCGSILVPLFVSTRYG